MFFEVTDSSKEVPSGRNDEVNVIKAAAGLAELVAFLRLVVHYFADVY
jgi:hypothetical protein